MIFCKPEELVVHELFIMFGPIVSELGNLKIEFSDGMGAQQQGSTLSRGKIKVLLEEVHCHFTSSHRIGMTLLSGGLIPPKPRHRILAV